MTKRLQLFLLFLVAFSIMDSAADEINGINYTLSRSSDSNFPSKAEVTKLSKGSYSGNIEIPEKVEKSSGWGGWWGGGSSTTTYKVTSIAKNAFSDSKNLTSVTIPSGVTSIGDNAFSNCTSLKSVYSNMLYPMSLGNRAFSSVPSDCVLYIPIGTLTAYQQAGWTKESIGITIVEVGDAEENFCVENEVNHQFIQNVVYPDDDYSFTRITDYSTQSTSYRKDLPAPVRIIPPVVEEGKSLVLETYADGKMVRSDQYVLESKLLEIWNLIPQKSYTYKLYVVNADDTKTEVASGNFTTEGLVRMLNIGYIYNFRDIGGWPLSEGKRVKYDKIFRTGELEIDGNFCITSEGIDELLNVQGIGVELDFGDYPGSPVQSSVEYYNGNSYQIQQYTRAIRNTPQQYKNCFEKTVNALRADKKVIFHCNLGADRTGTYAFMLEGLLGVSESDIAKEYEMTSYTYDERYRTADENDNDEYQRGYRKLVNYVKTNYTGNTFHENIEQMALSFGISQKDIDDFRSLMTESMEVAPLVILDEESTTAPTAAENVNVTVRRTIKANEWSTICLPFAMTAHQMKAAFGHDVQLAEFNNYTYDEQTDKMTISFVNVSAIEANHPYIIKVSQPVEAFTVEGVNITPEEAVIDFDNSPLKDTPRQMTGTYVANTVLNMGQLFISNNKFYYSVGKTKMKGYRAYFNFDDILASFADTNNGNTYSARISLTFDPVVVTQISNPSVAGQTGDDAYYDLQGRRVAKPRKGLYIRNGRKTVVRGE